MSEKYKKGLSSHSQVDQLAVQINSTTQVIENAKLVKKGPGNYLLSLFYGDHVIYRPASGIPPDFGGMLKVWHQPDPQQRPNWGSAISSLRASFEHSQKDGH